MCHERKTLEVPCQIGGDEWIGALCDVEASINIMSLTIFVRCNIKPLSLSPMKLILGDRSLTEIVGTLHDVLVTA